MVIVHSKDVTQTGGPGVEMKGLLEKDTENGKHQLGWVRIAPGARIPVEGYGAHEQDELSYIVKGSIVVGIGDVEYHLTEGDATLIPVGEAHYAYNQTNEETSIVWTLIDRK